MTGSNTGGRSSTVAWTEIQNVRLCSAASRTSRCNFFEPVFMVQPTENILRSYLAIGWQNSHFRIGGRFGCFSEGVLQGLVTLAFAKCED